jgi:hypothetical protein
MSFILRIFDWGCKLELMNNLINYSELDIFENELCELGLNFKEDFKQFNGLFIRSMIVLKNKYVT